MILDPGVSLLVFVYQGEWEWPIIQCMFSQRLQASKRKKGEKSRKNIGYNMQVSTNALRHCLIYIHLYIITCLSFFFHDKFHTPNSMLQTNCKKLCVVSSMIHFAVKTMVVIAIEIAPHDLYHGIRIGKEIAKCSFFQFPQH